jgi:hypothetical protein
VNRRGFGQLISALPIGVLLSGIGLSEKANARTKGTLSWPIDVPPIATWTYANGDELSSEAKRKVLAKTVCRFPLISVISMDRDHKTGKFLKNCSLYRNMLRETNPEARLLGHLNASESHTPSSPGQRIIYAVGGEHGRLGNEPQNNPGTIWLERPKGHVVIRHTPWGAKSMMDFRLHRAQDTLFSAMETQYISGPSGRLGEPGWDGLFLDQLIVPGLRWGVTPLERKEMISGLQIVLSRFRSRYPNAIVIGNSPLNFADINGEVNEGRGDDLDEVASSLNHAEPELNVYMYKPAKPASETTIAAEMNLALERNAFFSYHFGRQPFSFSPWPKSFSTLLDSYPKWRDYLTRLHLVS